MSVAIESGLKVVTVPFPDRMVTAYWAVRGSLVEKNIGLLVLGMRFGANNPTLDDIEDYEKLRAPTVTEKPPLFWVTEVQNREYIFSKWASVFQFYLKFGRAGDPEVSVERLKRGNGEIVTIFARDRSLNSFFGNLELLLKASEKGLI